MKTLIEVTITDLEYDTGYGVTGADLVCEVEVEEVDNVYVASVKEGTWFLYDRDGGNLNDIPYECCSHDKTLEEEAIELFKKAVE